MSGLSEAEGQQRGHSGLTRSHLPHGSGGEGAGGGGAWGKRELQVWVHQAYELMLRRGRRLGLHQQWQLVTFQRLHGLALF